ncbi:hypothetical protein EJ05DRAFT_27934 [Pseudovirgaria hyperparasitica]|uniref:Uncharacterized protein n=1 Tax=Pseudovirgaria hyperparasitica TaxID=470096 RepID=A0A6A6WLX4_9PEZI|nr:uncharacterized protein EJ05DRAFT_27934 [Pseudovirgaria hyperparasitica]KAF2763162.1 hypothetical protein EJ05DRAFT_27934 [Pseudovirgaria hyperparasitica]
MICLECCYATERKRERERKNTCTSTVDGTCHVICVGSGLVLALQQQPRRGHTTVPRITSAGSLSSHRRSASQRDRSTTSEPLFSARDGSWSFVMRKMRS